MADDDKTTIREQRRALVRSSVKSVTGDEEKAEEVVRERFGPAPEEKAKKEEKEEITTIAEQEEALKEEAEKSARQAQAVSQKPEKTLGEIKEICEENENLPPEPSASYINLYYGTGKGGATQEEPLSKEKVREKVGKRVEKEQRLEDVLNQDIESTEEAEEAIRTVKESGDLLKNEQEVLSSLRDIAEFQRKKEKWEEEKEPEKEGPSEKEQTIISKIQEVGKEMGKDVTVSEPIEEPEEVGDLIRKRMEFSQTGGKTTETEKQALSLYEAQAEAARGREQVEENIEVKEENIEKIESELERARAIKESDVYKLKNEDTIEKLKNQLKLAKKDVERFGGAKKQAKREAKERGEKAEEFEEEQEKDIELEQMGPVEFGGEFVRKGVVSPKIVTEPKEFFKEQRDVLGEAQKRIGKEIEEGEGFRFLQEEKIPEKMKENAPGLAKKVPEAQKKFKWWTQEMVEKTTEPSSAVALPSFAIRRPKETIRRIGAGGAILAGRFKEKPIKFTRKEFVPDISLDLIVGGVGAGAVIQAQPQTQPEAVTEADLSQADLARVDERLIDRTGIREEEIPSPEKMPKMGEERPEPQVEQQPIQIPKTEVKKGVEIQQVRPETDTKAGIERIEPIRTERELLLGERRRPGTSIEVKEGLKPEEVELLEEKRGGVEITELTEEGRVAELKREDIGLPERFEGETQPITAEKDRISGLEKLTKKRKGLMARPQTQQRPEPLSEDLTFQKEFPEADIEMAEEMREFEVIQPRERTRAETFVKTKPEVTTKPEFMLAPFPKEIAGFEEGIETGEIEDVAEAEIEDIAEVQAPQQAQVPVQTPTVTEQIKPPEFLAKPEPREQPFSLPEPQPEPQPRPQEQPRPFPKFPFPSGEEEQPTIFEEEAKKEREGRRQKFKPSLIALAGDITAEEAPEEVTGFGVRPIVSEKNIEDRLP